MNEDLAPSELDPALLEGVDDDDLDDMDMSGDSPDQVERQFSNHGSG
jgi:hypothetical protein